MHPRPRHQRPDDGHDGDLRRHMNSMPEFLTRAARDVMTSTPVMITGNILAVEALNVMETRRITSLVVVDGNQTILGVLHVHDLWTTTEQS